MFQNRYGSLLVDDERYLRALICYVHLNPVRARLVGSLSELARYPWSGHAALMGGGRPFQAVDEVLRWFAPEPRLARASRKSSAPPARAELARSSSRCRSSMLGR